MPSQRTLDIDALISLAQTVAYVIHGENHAELARQIAHKHAGFRHILIAETTASGDFTPFFSLDGESQEWPQPDVSATALLLSGGTTATLKLIPPRHADYNYNFSASAGLCGINQQSVYLAVLPVAHNFPLACTGRPMSSWFRHWRNSGCRPGSGKTATSRRFVSFRWVVPGSTHRLRSK